MNSSTNFNIPEINEIMDINKKKKNKAAFSNKELIKYIIYILALIVMCFLGYEWAEDEFIEGVYMIKTGQCNNIFNRILSTWNRGNSLCDIYNKVSGSIILLISPSNESRAGALVYISGSIFLIYKIPTIVDGLVDKLAGTIDSNSPISKRTIENLS